MKNVRMKTDFWLNDVPFEPVRVSNARARYLVSTGEYVYTSKTAARRLRKEAREKAAGYVARDRRMARSIERRNALIATEMTEAGFSRVADAPTTMTPERSAFVEKAMRP